MPVRARLARPVRRMTGWQVSPAAVDVGTIYCPFFVQHALSASLLNDYISISIQCPYLMMLLWVISMPNYYRLSCNSIVLTKTKASLFITVVFERSICICLDPWVSRGQKRGLTENVCSKQNNIDCGEGIYATTHMGLHTQPAYIWCIHVFSDGCHQFTKIVFMFRPVWVQCFLSMLVYQFLKFGFGMVNEWVMKVQASKFAVVNAFTYQNILWSFIKIPKLIWSTSVS